MKRMILIATSLVVLCMVSVLAETMPLAQKDAVESQAHWYYYDITDMGAKNYNVSLTIQAHGNVSLQDSYLVIAFAGTNETQIENLGPGYLDNETKNVSVRLKRLDVNKVILM